MKETDYAQRIEIVQKWLETAKSQLNNGDFESAFNNVSSASIELSAIQKRMNRGEEE